MKKITFLSALLAILAASCTLLNQTKQKPHFAILSGKIANANVDSARILNRNLFYDVKIPLKKDGSFQTKIALKNPQFYRFFIGNQYASIFLKPGDTVQLTLDAKNFDKTTKFSGNDAASNNYLVAALLKSEKENLNYQDYYDTTITGFIKKSDAIREAKFQFLQSYVVKKALPTAFLEYAKGDVEYNWARARMAFPEYYAYYSAQKKAKSKDSVKADTISPSYYDFAIGLDTNQSEMLALPAYRNYLWAYFSYRMDTANIKNPAKNTDNAYRLIDKNIKDSATKTFLFFKTMQRHFMYFGAKDVKEAMSGFKKAPKIARYDSVIDIAFNKWKKLEKGQPAPTFDYTSFEGKKVDLKSLRGEYVYVDVWATWCGPCRHEIPYLLKLEKKYEGNKNIAFVSVSIDANKKAWQKFVPANKLTGIQLIADGAWKASICNDYMIKGIPRFILIDPKGNIINANADRPSGDIGKIIAKLLQNNKNV